MDEKKMKEGLIKISIQKNNYSLVSDLFYFSSKSYHLS